MGKMEVNNNYKRGKRDKWKAIIEYVPFPNERVRQRSYELFAESILNAYRNKQKLTEKQQNLENLTS
ncbi:MAG: hypothetical protein V2A65_02295 [Candidatus Omnitrophota bacterium]